MPAVIQKYGRDHSAGHGEHNEWLQLLIGDWQVISDLMFADLVLWGREDDDTVRALAHCRPATGATVYYEDPVDQERTREQRPDLFECFDAGQHTGVVPIVADDTEARSQSVPVRHSRETIAVLSVESSPEVETRTLEQDVRFRDLGGRLLDMVERGEYPIFGAPIPPRRGAPRVVDGIVELDVDGVVVWASPNALSGFHRFGVEGNLVGTALAEVTTDVLQTHTTVDESLPLVLTGRAAWRSDMQAHGRTLSMRAIPFTENHRRTGAMVLVRDVSDLRRRERELITKDATIREVNHRVKNNLQTVAALLRLQRRRMKTDEAREALYEAERRVTTIALVHEALTQGFAETVDFDEIVDKCVSLAADVGSATVRHSASASAYDAELPVVETSRYGKVGLVRAEEATPLALVVTEMATNAVEHGLAGTGGMLSVRAQRVGAHLQLHIEDDGRGMRGKKPEGLGTQIAQTLISGELDGTISWGVSDSGGTRATIEVYLDPVVG